MIPKVSAIYNKNNHDFLKVFSFDILSKLFMGLSAIIIIRILTPIEYAQFVRFSTLSNFLLGVFGSGMALSFVRYASEQISRKNREVVLSLYILSSIFIFSVFMITSLFIPFISLGFNASVTVVSCSIIYGFLLSMIRLNQSYYQVQEAFSKSGIVDNMKNIIIFLLLLSSFILLDISIYLIIGFYLFAGIITLIVSFQKIYYPQKNERKKIKLTLLTKMFRESYWLIIYGVILNLFNQMDIFMLSSLADDHDVAVYGVAFRYYALLLTLLPSIQAVLRVRTSKKEYIDNKNIRYEFTIKWIKKTSKVAIPFCLFVIVVSEFLFPVLNGNGYNDAILVFQILTLGVGMSYIFAPNVNIVMSSKKYKELCFFACISLFINTFGNLIFIPLYGTTAAAVSTIISQAILNVLSTLLVLVDSRKDYKNG